MVHLVEFPLERGGGVLVEVPQAGTSLTTRGGIGSVQERATESFDRAVAKVKPAAEALLAALSELSQRPEEVSVEFGVNMSAEAGAFIGSLGAEATFKVALKWQRTEPASPTLDAAPEPAAV